MSTWTGERKIVPNADAANEEVKRDNNQMKNEKRTKYTIGIRTTTTHIINAGCVEKGAMNPPYNIIQKRKQYNTNVIIANDKRD